MGMARKIGMIGKRWIAWGIAGIVLGFLLTVARPVFAQTRDGRALEAALGPVFEAAERRYRIPRGLLQRVAQEESRFRSDIVTGDLKSSAGAIGIMQFIPATAKEVGIDPLKPMEAIPGAARYLRQQFDRFGSWELALAAYNWGPGNVSRRGFRNAPTETKRYVAAILGDVVNT